MPKVDDALERFHDEVRARWEESVAPPEMVVLAKSLCRAEGREPDRVVVGGNRTVFARDGFGGAIIAEAHMFHPAWVEYYAMAEGVITEFQVLIVPSDAKAR